MTDQVNSNQSCGGFGEQEAGWAAEFGFFSQGRHHIEYQRIKTVSSGQELDGGRISTIQRLRNPIRRDFQRQTLQQLSLVTTVVLALSRNERNMSDKITALVRQSTFGIYNSSGGSATNGHVKLVILSKRAPFGAGREGRRTGCELQISPLVFSTPKHASRVVA